MSIPSDIEKARSNVNLYQSSLDDMDGFLGTNMEHTWNSFMSYVTGVIAPVTKPAADAALNAMMTELKAGKKLASVIANAKGVKDDYDIITKIIDAATKMNKNPGEGLGALAEAKSLIEGDKSNELLSKIVQIEAALVESGNKEKALMDLGMLASKELAKEVKDGAFEFLPNVVDDANKIVEGIDTASKNYEEWSEDSNRMVDMFDRQRDEWQGKLDEANAELYKLTGGKEGSIDGLKNSDNVFHRLDAILAEIGAGIESVKTNIGQ